MAEPQRLYYFAHDLDIPSAELGPNDNPAARSRCDEAGANLISSETEVEGLHLPVIDVDHGQLGDVTAVIAAELGAYAALRTRYVPSRTAGHYHAYVDAPTWWDAFRTLLAALEGAGLIQSGYYGVSVKRGATFVRKPPEVDVIEETEAARLAGILPF